MKVKGSLRALIPVLILALLLSASTSGCRFFREKALSDTKNPAGVPLTDVTESTASSVIASGSVLLDYSDAASGFVTLIYTGSSQKVKTLITSPGGTVYVYSQSLNGVQDVYPLSEGSGSYQISVHENLSGTRYSTVFSAVVVAALTDEFQPFIRPNKFVNYSAGSALVLKAETLCAGKLTVLEKITEIYRYVVGSFTYDYQLAQTVKSGYVPELDAVMQRKKGICFDYAALMTAMLRSQGIPTKLVFGYTGTTYHAWILVYSTQAGWVNTSIYFSKNAWKLMDPTFASTGRSSKSILAYIGNSANYTAKYYY